MWTLYVMHRQGRICSVKTYNWLDLVWGPLYVSSRRQLRSYTLLCYKKRKSEGKQLSCMACLILLSLKTDQHYLELAPAPRACPTEPAWYSACCRPSWACRCPGNNSRIVAGVALFGSSASLYRCWLWCGLWDSTCITAASGSTSRP